MTKCTHFIIQELVDRATFEKFGEQAWMLFNPIALEALDDLRRFFNAPVIVNNWHEGGQFQYRGFRPRSCSIGAEYSQHRFGNAFDCDIQGVTAQEARKKILENQDNLLLFQITRLEDKVNWVHMDCANIDDRIKVIQP